MMSETLSIKITSSEKARLKALAAARNIPVSDLIREGLHKVLSETADSEQPSCYDLFATDLENLWSQGGSGIGDLSSNKTHMKGFGES
jgi:hypothetical protein